MKAWFVVLGSLLAISARAESFDPFAYEGRLVVGVWQDSWTDTLAEQLVESGLYLHKEKQIETMCPGYNKYEEKRYLFWTQLFISLGWRESLHGPENWVRFNGGVNNGLYQINPELRAAYGCHDFDLFEPHANITCAVKMAKKLVTRDKSFLKGSKGGMAAYWQPLRSTSKLNRQNREFILSAVRKACKNNQLAYHSRSNIVLPADFMVVPNVMEDEEDAASSGDEDLIYQPATFRLSN